MVSDHECVSTAAAKRIIIGGLIAIVALYLILSIAFDPDDKHGLARISAGISLLAFLCIFGCIMTAVMVVGPRSRLQVDWRGFARLSMDIGLLPVIVAPSMVVCLKLGQVLVALLATPIFGDRFANILGLEFGWFAVLLGVPYLFYVWPIFHTVNRVQSLNGYRLAPKTWMLISGFSLCSALLVFARPTTAFWFTFVITWMSFTIAYHFLLLPGLPRYSFETANGLPTIRNGNAG